MDSGTLYVVATPIGNRSDLSPRAAEVLGVVSAILAEDTRHVQRLTGDLGIRAERIALHAHNEEARIPGLLEWLRSGADLALVTDAGVPGVSDPGARLVAAAHDAGIPVRTIPGPSAVTAALSVAGMPADRFVFEGFLPTKGAARKARVRAIAGESRSVVLFESPRRIGALLAELANTCGDGRPALVARELTKRFETVRRGALRELAEAFAAGDENSRGEVTVCIAPASQEHREEERGGPDADAILQALAGELPPSRAARVAARLTGRTKDELYRRALALKGED